jgi:hypothetical protein
LLILYTDGMATREHARAVWQPKQQTNMDREGEGETSDDDQIGRMVEKGRDVLEIIDVEPEDDRVEDSLDRFPRHPSHIKIRLKKRVAEESLGCCLGCMELC